MLTQRDPHGRDAHTPGAKLDHAKPRPALILRDMNRAISAVLEVAEKGALKYTDGGWLLVHDGAERYLNAAIRHTMQELAGEARDAELNVLHAACTAWNSLARLELLLRAEEQRQPPPPLFTLVEEREPPRYAYTICPVCAGKGDVVNPAQASDEPLQCGFCNGTGTRRHG